MAKKKVVDIKSIIYDYLSEGIYASEGLSVFQTKTIYLLALKDFFEGKLTEREIQDVAGDLLYVFQKTPTDIWEVDSVLGSALDDAADIVYYWERVDEDLSNKKIYEARYKGMKDYYEANKKMIEKKKKE